VVTLLAVIRSRCFDSRPGYSLSWLRRYEVFLSPSR
jgi:hypothetical protein